MKSQLYILLSLLLITLTSCEQYIVMEMPDLNPQFVINGTLEPGQPVIISVTRTKGVLEDINIWKTGSDGQSLVNNFEPVRNATVKLTVDGKTTYNLKFEERLKNSIDFGSYVNDEIIIEEGRTYELEVSGSGLPTASSKVVIPKLIPIRNLTHKEGKKLDPVFASDFFPMREFRFEFDDPLGPNYYEIHSWVETINHGFTERGEPVTWSYGEYLFVNAKHPAYFRELNFGVALHLLVNDLLFKERAVSLEYSHYLPPLEVSNEFDVTVYFKHISEDWYRYETTAALQRTNRGDPLSQPVQVFSNIKNGVGILKAASTYELTIKVLID